MGSIIGSREHFVESLIDIAGYKAGVIVSEDELFDLLRDQGVIGEIIDPAGPGGGRINSTEYADAVVYLLYKLGNLPSPDNIPISIELYHKYMRVNQLDLLHSVQKIWIEKMKGELNKPNKGGKLDPSAFLKATFYAHGTDGLEIAMEIIEGTNRDMHRSAWANVRAVDWVNSVELNDLFASAGLEVAHGRFFDQRYIDYLSQNFEEIDRMHWRKFEGFTAEFFQREGFNVALGPGTNDDGIDLRIYPPDGDTELPPLIIVQCKRQKAKIEKALVKSVYADVLHEKAGSGLIVTTSALAPGAEATRVARGYPVDTADRPTIRKWIDKLRS